MSTPQLPSPDQQDPASDLRALTSLVIGGVEVGAEELFNRLRQWEQQTTQYIAEQRLETGQDNQQPAAETPQELARYALIGLIFDMQDRLKTNLSILGRLQRLAGRFIDPILSPLANSRLLSPARRRTKALIARGQAEVERWIRLGRSEDERARVLAEISFDEVVDAYIEYLAANPEVQDLVQAQSSGLATEVVEEVRERTVSADTFLEGVARSLLRRAPRRTLPAPTEEVRRSAQMPHLPTKPPDKR